MTMKKIVLTTHWSPEEVYDIVQFLAELRETITHNYAAELDEFYRDTHIERQYENLEFEDDIIPF